MPRKGAPPALSSVDTPPQWARERAVLLIAAVVAILLLLAAAAGIALRFERDGARLYVENMHAVVRVTALQLEETFSQAEQFVELLA
ncbi:MAG: hypothetical protein ABIJ09_22685, partial [Pseudomonadota bacterium]